MELFFEPYGIDNKIFRNFDDEFLQLGFEIHLY